MEWERLHEQEYCNVYCSASMILAITSSRDAQVMWPLCGIRDSSGGEI
jgi:hypothetical protein